MDGPMTDTAIVPALQDDARPGETPQRRHRPARDQNRCANAKTLLSLAGRIERLRVLQQQRLFAIKVQSFFDRKTDSFIAGQLGFTPEMRREEGKGKKLFALAKKIREAVEAGEIVPSDDATYNEAMSNAFAIIEGSKKSRFKFDNLRKQSEAEMREIAHTLPAWDWVEQVSGFSDLGFAVVIAEAGDLSNYPEPDAEGRPRPLHHGPACLHKRLGLTPYKGKAGKTWKIDAWRDGARALTSEEWTEFGYSQKRRAQIYAFLDDTMFKHQWRGDKDEDGKNPSKTGKETAEPAHPIGPYGVAYGLRYARTLDTHPEWTDAHRNNDARRIMAKRLLEDLWQAWRAARVTMS